MRKRIPVTSIGLALTLGLAVLAAQHKLAEAGSKTPTTVEESPRDQAQRRFAHAKELYRAGRYRAAIEELRAARDLDPDGAELVYNLGVVHEKLGEVDQAIEQYKRYVTMISDEQEQNKVQGIIQRLEGARTELAPVPSSAAPASASAVVETRPPPPPSPSPRSSRGRFDGWVIASGALAGAGLVAGTIYGVLALQDRMTGTPQTGKGSTIGELQDRQDKAQREAVIADVCFGTALAAGITGAVLYFSRETREVSRSPQQSGFRFRLAPSFAVWPGGANAQIGTSF